jgi:GcrA cell cycle regulator
MSATVGGWTDERVASLKKLWLEGLSASQIAKQLGGVTRNAVIGKVHRLGLSGRATPAAPARTVFKAPRAPRPVLPVAHPPRRVEPIAAASPVPSLPAVREEPGSATVLTLGAHMCKWPIGDPSTDGFTFCGRRTGQEGPYCHEHARVAYQPAMKKGKRSDAAELARSLRRYI